MKARQLIEEHGSFSPDERTVLCAALEDAWSSIMSRYNDAQSSENARIRLAGFIVLLARSGLSDRAALSNAAIQMMSCETEQ